MLFNSFWCLECGETPKVSCEGRHAILDRMEDVKQSWLYLLTSLAIGAKPLRRGNRLKSFCRLPRLPTTSSCINRVHWPKKAKLSADKIRAFAAKTKLEETLKQAKEEAEKTNKVWNDLIGNGKVVL